MLTKDFLNISNTHIFSLECESKKKIFQLTVKWNVTKFKMAFKNYVAAVLPLLAETIYWNISKNHLQALITYTTKVYKHEV